MASQNVDVTIRARDLTAAAFAAVNKALMELEGHAGGASAKTREVGEATGGTLSIMKGMIGSQLIMQGLSAAWDGLKSSVFGMNATLETSELKFATLMGSSQKAKEHVADLFEIAKKTPFETGPIIDASIKLQTFGGAALNTKANILLLGDAAAATGAPIDELGMWTGRLYAMLQAGKPFGEAAMRLQELAVMSPQARDEMERLQKAGKSAEEIFSVFQGSLGKFTGAMEKQAGTWTGVISTLTDSVKMTLADAFKPVFTTIRDGVAGVNTLLSSEAFGEGVKAMSGSLSAGLGTFLALLRAAAGPISTFIGGITEVAGALWKLEEAYVAGISGDAFALVQRVWKDLTDLWGTASGLVTDRLIPAFRSAWDTLKDPALEYAISAGRGMIAVFGLAWDLFKMGAEAVWTVLEPLASPVWDAAVSVGSALLKTFGLVWDLVGGLARGVSWLIEKFDLQTKATGFLSAVLGPLVSVIKGAVIGVGWLADGVGWVVDKIRDLLSMAGLTADELPKVQGAALNLTNEGLGPAADAAGLLDGTLGQVAGSGLPDTTKAMGGATAATAKFAEEVDKLRKTLFSTDDTDKMKVALEALGGKGNIGKLADDSLKSLLGILDKGADSLRAAKQAIPAEVGAIWIATMEKLKLLKDPDLNKGEDDLAGILGLSPAQIRKAETTWTREIKDFARFAAEQTEAAINALPKIDIGVLIGGKDGKSSSIADEKYWTSTGKRIGVNLTSGLLSVAAGIGGTIQRAIEGGGGWSAAWASLGVQAGGVLGDTIGQEVGSKISASLSKDGATSIMGQLKNKLGGALGGIMSGGISAAISVGMGLLTKGIGAAWGALTKQEGRKVNDLRDAYIAAAGGFNELAKKAVEAGTSIDQLLKAKNVKDYEAAIASLNTRLTATAKIQGELSTLQSQLADRAVLDLTKAQEICDKYGFSIDTLGQKFRDAKSAASWKEVWADFQTLTDMGADAGASMEGLKGKIVALAFESTKFGTEIPEQFRPFIERLFAAGELVDENGTKITDLSQLKFGAPLVSEVDKIVAAIKELVDQLKNQLTPQINAVPREVRVKVGYDYETFRDRADMDGGDGGDRMPAYATGGLIERAQIARVGEGGEPELIGPVGFMTKALAGALQGLGLAGAATATLGRSGSISLTIPVVINNREVGRAVIADLPALLAAQGVRL